MDDKILLDFKQITPESIALTFKGKYEKGGLDRLEQIRSDISVLLLTNN